MSTIRHRMLIVGVLLAGAGCADRTPTTPGHRPPEKPAFSVVGEPVNGQFIRATGTHTVYLAFKGVLYGIPDPQTLEACTGNRPAVVREVASLPNWPGVALPSAGDPKRRPHGNVWMFGDRPIQSDAGGAAYALVGCVRSGIPDPATYQALYGDQNWGRIQVIPDAVFRQLPDGPLAQAVPLRRAGTLVEYGGPVRWVTYHGGSLGVPDPATMDAYCRPWSDLFSSAAEFNAYPQQAVLQAPGSGCLRGNDYPYASASTSGVDPWNYYYRQCTSFAAWRLNQHGFEFHNRYLGQHWGNANSWDDAARAAGVPVNKTAKYGAIAQWEGASWNGGYGHVAFVAAVHNDGTITIEEYNYSAYAYSSRKISASSVNNYIHLRS